jgi:hypothetical protein
MAETTIPVVVAEDAAARVAELGMQRELEKMIEHTRQVVPRLRAIHVTLEYDPACPSNDPGVVIWAHRDDLSAEEAWTDQTDWDWGGWKVTTFPPEVCQHFVMLSEYGDAHGW